MMISIIYSGCMIPEIGSGGQKTCSVATVCMFSIVGFLYIVVCFLLITLFFIMGYCSDGIQCWFSEVKTLVRRLVQVLAGLLYYIGDNLDLILSNIGCTESCIARAQSASFAFLLLAGILYLILSSNTADRFAEVRSRTKWNNDMQYSDEPSSCEQLLPICVFIHNLSKFDTIYTAITLATRLSNNTCGTYHESYEIVSWIYFSLVPLLLLAKIFGILIHHWLQHYSYIGWKTWLCQCLSAFAVTVVISLYLLADNEFPLNCATENRRILGIVRLVLMILVAIIFLSIASYALYYHHKAASRVAPWVR